MRILVLAVVASCGLYVMGCSSTAEGIKQDTSKDTAAVGAAANQAGQEAVHAGAQVEAVGENAHAAASLTPRIKAAIVRDPVLNDSRNTINVDSGETMVNLTGHVVTQKMKDRATDDAQKVLDEKHRKQQIHNDLKVTSGA